MDFKIWGFVFLVVVSIPFRVLPSYAISIQEQDHGEDKGKEMAAPRALSTSDSRTANKRISAVIRTGGAVGGRGGGGVGQGGGDRARGATILGGAGGTVPDRRHNGGNKSVAMSPYLCLASSVILMFNFIV